MRHGVLAHAALDQGVAIGRQADSAFGADNTAGAADVFDHHRLLQNFAQLIGHQSAHHIAGATGWKGHHQLDRPIGVIALRENQCWGRRQTDGRDTQRMKELSFQVHDRLLL